MSDTPTEATAQTFEEWWTSNGGTSNEATKEWRMVAREAWNAALRSRPVLDDEMVERIAKASAESLKRMLRAQYMVGIAEANIRNAIRAALEGK